MSVLIDKTRTKLYTHHRGMIFLNFINDDGSRGCNFNCSFCCWHNKNFNKKLCPSNEALTEFFNTYFPTDGPDDTKIDAHITGGGDPLYKFDKNKTELLRIINCVKSLGCTVSIVTHEIETVAKYWDNELAMVDFWILSYEGKSKELQTTAKHMIENGKGVQITKIFNYTADQDDINWDNIKEFIKFYKDIPVYFRINFEFDWDDYVIDLRNKLYLLKGLPEYGTNFYLRPDNKRHLGLYNDEVWNTKDFDDLIRFGDTRD